MSVPGKAAVAAAEIVANGIVIVPGFESLPFVATYKVAETAELGMVKIKGAAIAIIERINRNLM